MVMTPANPLNSLHEPSEGSLYEWFCIFLDADTMSDDQLVEISRKQPFERLARGLSISERQPDDARKTAMRICSATKFEQSLEKGLTLRHWMILGEISYQKC